MARKGIKTARGKNQAEELAKALNMKPTRQIPRDIKDWDDDLLQEKYIDIMEEFLMLRRARVPHGDDAWKWVMARSTQLATEMDKRGLKPKPLEDIKKEYADRLGIDKNEFDLPEARESRLYNMRSIWQSDEYKERVRELEQEGLTTSDAQAVADAEFRKRIKADGLKNYLNEHIMFGGDIVTRGKAITIMQDEGTPQKYIDRYMQGARTIEAEGVIFGADVRQRYDALKRLKRKGKLPEHLEDEYHWLQDVVKGKVR